MAFAHQLVAEPGTDAEQHLKLVLLDPEFVGENESASLSKQDLVVSRDADVTPRVEQRFERKHVRVAHFLVSSAGQFRLTALPGGRTRLEGTTLYRYHMWPAAYWQLWSDFIIGRIHLRVLNHVKSLSESDAGRYNPAEP